MSMKEQHTFSFEHDGHDIDAILNYSLVLDDYGVPGSPKFWSVDWVKWEDFVIDGITMSDNEIIREYGADFFDKIIYLTDRLFTDQGVPTY